MWNFVTKMLPESVSRRTQVQLKSSLSSPDLYTNSYLAVDLFVQQWIKL